MEIKLEELKELLKEAYEKGWKGSLDLCDSVVEEIVSRLEDEPVEKKQNQQQLYLFNNAAEELANQMNNEAWSVISQMGNQMTFTVNSTYDGSIQIDHGIQWIEEDRNEE